MSDLIHVSHMSREQVIALTNELKETLIKFAQDNNLSGLSEANSHNFYLAVEDAVMGQWDNARKEMGYVQ